MGKTIWYVSKYFATGTTGSVGTRGWLILKKFIDYGEQVVVIASDSNHLAENPKLDKKIKHEKIDDIEIVWLKTFKYSIAKSSFRVLSWIHFEWNFFWLKKSSLPRPDVVIVSSLSLLTILNGYFLKKRFGCKLIFEIRDIWPLTLIEEGGFSSYNPLIIFLGIIEWFGYKYSDLIVGTMPNLGEHVKGILGYERRVICIPMVVDPGQLLVENRVNEKYLESYFDKNFFNIVYAGTIGITNALRTLFEAAKSLADNQNIRFIIVGDGALRESYLREYGDLPNLFFAPKVSKNQVFSVLSSADLVYFSVFKSKVWDYGQSLNKLVDYMLSGKLILASYSGFPSMINESNCGYFVPSDDVEALVEKIQEISKISQTDREIIGSRGRYWLLENRSVDKVAKVYLDNIYSLG